MHNGLKIAGADSAYIAFLAYCAGFDDDGCFSDAVTILREASQ